MIDERWDTSIIPALMQYIPIPNKSPDFDPNWEDNGYMLQAVKLLKNWVENSEVEYTSCDIITLPGRTPTLFIEIAATEPDGSDNCVLLYGHYDKQPEFDGWHEGLGPWLAVEKDGKLYGRGGADDGYALFASLTAIEVLQQQNIPHPRCVLLIEGCEESGSYDLPYYVDQLRDRIGTPTLVVCLDAGCGNYDQLWTTTSLRGMLPGTLKVKILEQGQHSGVAGGIVPSTFRIVRQLMERIEDANSGQMHAAVNVEIPASAVTAARDMAQILGREVIDQFPWTEGAQPEADDMAELILDNTWRASLATVGFAGAPAIADAGNTLRPETQVKLVIRLPPSAEAEVAADEIKSILETNPPYGAQVEFEVQTPQTGWSSPPEAQWLSAALNQSSQIYFGKPAARMGLGGTIPFMKMLGDAYPQTQFMVAGVLGPHSNAHGPNEFLHIEMGKKLTACVAHVLAATP
ncbi:MAG: acetylornithine deacetylase/succinyl-diaminopimelate desuccinylase-like protein [Limisphaerales bacterium]|jgi:acetylornithine deacetylase/succinyl-diaminopimelate desuccinylase-like protein